MANRLNAPNQFETLAPPWVLSQLDTNFTQNQSAWNDSSLGFMNGLPTDTGSANAYAITLPLGVPTSYRAGMCVSFIPANSNTGASTVTVSPLGSAAIVNPANIALQGGEIAANRRLDLIHDGTNFRIAGPCPLSFNTSTASTSLSVECAGYTRVAIVVTFNIAGTGFTLTLSHLAQGVGVTVVLFNTSGSNKGILLAATNPAGTAFSTISGFASGTVNGNAGVNLISTGLQVSNGSAFVFNGAPSAPTLLHLSY